MKITKGTIIVLVLILFAGMGLYLAYINNDIQKPPAATAGSTLAELWSAPDGQTRTLAPPTQGSSTRASAASATSDKSTKATTTKPATSTATTAPASSASLPGSSNSKYIYAKEYQVYPGQADIPPNQYLICVNRSRALPAKFSVNTEICLTVYPEKIQLETEAAQQYRKMYEAALKEDKTLELIPFSGYRSTARQKENFDREVAELVAAKVERQEAIRQVMQTIQLPGCSEHETGLAIDITRKGVWKTDPAFDGTKEFAWLTKHAHEYGFILRYPQGKEASTGISYEPWHWRYVGTAEAKKIKDSGLCLEEYLKIKL